jgi:hypothetical protein
LVGSRVALRSIEPDDYPRIRQAETASAITLRWRLAGQAVSPETYAESLYSGVLATFVYEPAGGGPGFGIVSAYGADPRHGHAYIATARLEPFGGPIPDGFAMVDSMTLFIDFLFQGWSFRKLYIECADFNRPQFGSFLDRCEHEGSLVQHLYLDGRYWDLHTYSIWRDAWPVIRQVGPQKRRAAEAVQKE